MTNQKIKSTIIVQLAGAPPEYLLETLKTHVSRLDSFKNVEVISKKFSEPKPLKDKPEFFSVFSEIEFYSKSFSDLVFVVSEMLPSSIEISEPSNINIDSFEANDFLNNLAGKLHYYEDILRLVHARIKQLSPPPQQREDPKNREEKESLSYKKQSEKSKRKKK
ncbi:MAG: hypothetical protein QXX68_01175 [Candidatus Pacearchaeota archaeon]